MSEAKPPLREIFAAPIEGNGVHGDVLLTAEPDDKPDATEATDEQDNG